ncbi:MAG: hypothetical protein WDW36_010054 [Sanguina aurantia]
MRFNRRICSSSSTFGSAHSSIRFRPDMWWDLGSHMVIVEVDEHQHKKHDRKHGSAADAVRTQRLALDANKPVVFLSIGFGERQLQQRQQRSSGSSSAAAAAAAAAQQCSSKLQPSVE